MSESVVYLPGEIILYIGKVFEENRLHKMPVMSFTLSLDDELTVTNENGKQELVRSVLWSAHTSRQVIYGDNRLVSLIFPSYHPYALALVERMQHSWGGQAFKQANNEEELINFFSSIVEKGLDADAVYQQLDVLLLGSAKTDKQKISHLDARIQRVFELVKQEGPKKISAVSVAKTLDLSEGYFSRFFKKETKMTFAQYCLYVKLYQVIIAKTLTKNHAAAAHNAGFYDISHFNNTFKDTFGLPLSIFSGDITFTISKKVADAIKITRYK